MIIGGGNGNVLGVRLRRFPGLIAVALVGAVVALPAPALGAGDAEAEKFILALADQALEVLRDDTTTLEEREARLHVLLRNGFALEVIGRYVVGRHWRKMSPVQQSDYQNLFSQWTLKTYSGRLGGYSGQTFEVVKTVNTGKKDIFVRTRMHQADHGKPIAVDWRVRKNGDSYVIIDVVVEGISMLVTQKAEFAALLKKHGIEGLIEMLRARLSKLPVVAG